jgi:glucose-6-phosphate-specific signal transduction histidine kinase
MKRRIMREEMISMTEQLRQTLERLEKLPEVAQNAAAVRIQAIVDELAEQRWDELLADPRSAVFFDQMAERYEQAKREGAFQPLPRTSDDV